MLRPDCHCHTVHSDGTLTTKALLSLAKKQGLGALSITDHDTLDAYDSAFPEAKRLGLILLPGIEISAQYKTETVHVLGYAFHTNNPQITAVCTTLQQKRKERNQAIIERLQACQFPITLEALMHRFPHASLGRLHIARYLVEKGWSPSLKQVFKKYLGDKARCFVPDFQITVEEAIALIQKANGFAILAHPHTIRTPRTLEALCHLNFDGIEAYYAHHPLSREQKWIQWAQKKSWLITGGSDFHGTEHSHTSLGCSWTPPESFAILLKRFEENYA